MQKWRGISLPKLYQNVKEFFLIFLLRIQKKLYAKKHIKNITEQKAIEIDYYFTIFQKNEKKCEIETEIEAIFFKFIC